MQTYDCRRRRAGFTLIELLTVIGIIALLIGILVPSLSAARDQSRRVVARTTLAAIDKALEMFRNDFNHYPRSDIYGDPIVDVPGAVPDVNAMWGAHSLARALVGPDYGGVDTEGLMFKEGDDPANQITMAQVARMERTGVYMEDARLIPDTDPRWGEGDRHPPSGRPFVVDQAYEFPILYYRANPHAKAPFAQNGEEGVYAVWDNFGLTGISNDHRADSFWDFARTGADLPAHPLCHMGSVVPDRINNPTPFFTNGRSFQGCLHDAEALKIGNVVKPRNADRFILVHPGEDALWGTADDIMNF